MAPRNLSNSLLDTFILAQIECVPLLDVIEIASRESLEIWKLARQIRCDLLDHTIAPPARHLALGDQPAEIPIEQKELAVDGDCGLDLGSLNPRLEVGDELPIVLGGGQILRHGRKVEAKVTQRNRRMPSYAASSFFSG